MNPSPCDFRFNLLRELIPNKEKLDKAAFLMSTMDYIRQLQVCKMCERWTRGERGGKIREGFEDTSTHCCV